jgi:hypothetical protein
VIAEIITTAQAIAASIMATQTPLLIPSLWDSSFTVGEKNNGAYSTHPSVN